MARSKSKTELNPAGAFERCVKEVAARGSAYDPRAVCARAGVRKFGQAEMTRRAIAGKRRAARRRGNAPRVTQREVDSAAASYHNMLMAYGENNMATQRAEFKYRDLQRAYAEQKAKRAARGNPGKFTFKTESLGLRGALGVIFRDGVNVETVGPIQSFRAGFGKWSAKEDKAAAAAAARDRIRDLKQLEGTRYQAGPSYRGNVRPRGRGARLPRPVIGGGTFRGRPDYEGQMDAINEQIYEAMRKQQFKRVRDLQTKKQRLWSKVVGGLREGGARYSGSRGNPSRYRVEHYHTLLNKWLPSMDTPDLWRAKKRAGAIARSGWRVRVVDQETGKTEEELQGRRGRGNPAEAARAASAEIHGRPVKEMIPVTERRHYHKFLSDMGDLRKLVIRTHDGRRKVKVENFEGALLTFNEDKDQLYIKGGNQSVNLRDFGISQSHDIHELGELRRVDYYTNKHHLGDQGGPAVYFHNFSKPYPKVQYYTRDERLEISGGNYKITAEGIVG